MGFELVKKVVFITGCSAGGIGDALAQEFHSKGFTVFASARNLSRMSHLKDLGIAILEVDIINSSSVQSAVELIKSATGGTLDILVNNAGAGKKC